MRSFLVELLNHCFPHLWLRRRIADDQWDEIEARYLHVVVDPTRAAVDVGANVGKYSYGLAPLVPLVYALEPDAVLARKLRRALPRNVRVHAVAASNQEGSAELHFPVLNGRRSTALATVEPGVLAGQGVVTESETVQLVRLDQLIATEVGFIKIDVEGHELTVLQGALQLLQRDKPVVLVEAEERHRPGSVADVRGFMEALGYEGFFIRGGKLHCLSAFCMDMQDARELARPIKRVAMNYVNNFIFVSSNAASAFQSRLTSALAEDAAALRRMETGEVGEASLLASAD